MELNNGTESIVNDIDFICDTNSTSYPLADKVRNVNRWAYMATIAQIDGNSRFQFDDTNLVTLPHFTTTLVDGQGDYTLPSEFIRVERVEVMDSAGNYKRLIPFDHRDIKGGYDDFQETDGLPQYYDSVGNSIILKPAPSSTDVTTAKGLKVHILREIDIFTDSDITQQPGFPEPFHRVVVFGAAYDFLLARGDVDKAREYRQETENLLEKLTRFAGEMGEEHIRIRSAHRTANYL